MTTNNVKQWVVAGTVMIIGACGDPPATSDSQSGASADASTDATVGGVTEATATTSGGSNSESNGTTENAGSLSDSAATLPPCETSHVDTTSALSESDTAGQTGTGPATATEGDDTTGGDTTGMMHDCKGEDCPSTDGTTGEPSSTSTGGEPLGPCEKGNAWTLDADFDKGVLANVNHDAPGSDQLQITPNGFSAPKPYMYIAQTDEGRILKVDTVTGKQLARYPSLRLADCPTCNPNTATWAPSRITIDFDGDMYTANRAFNVQGAVTKIAGSEKGCIDRNGNGVIDTSSDVNNDGIVDINSPAEYKGQDDECILYSLPVAGVNGVLRALTLDGKGHLFVGAFNEYRAYKYDVTQTPPVLVGTYDLSSRPYGFAILGDYLYHSGLNWAPTARYDMANKVGKNMDVTQNYGMSIDSQGIGWYGAQFGLARCDYDDPKGFCDYFNVGEKIWGLTVDHHDQIWAAGAQTLYKFSNEGVLIGQAATPNSYGVAIGHDGNPRVIGWINAFAVQSGPVGGPPGAVTTYFTGHLGGVNATNYTYTDFTGFIAANFTVRKGEWSVVHDGGEANAKWAKVPYNTEPEAKIPASTSITVEVRAADTKAELVDQPWILVVDGALPNFAYGRFIEVRARLLITDPFVDESPVLSDVCVLKDGE
jgi:hypothetical protein